MLDTSSRAGPCPRTSLANCGRDRRVPLTILVLALFVASTSLALLAPAGTAGTHPLGAPHAAPAGSVTPKPAYNYPTPIRHVFTIVLENNELSTVQSQGPFEMHLAQKYAFASQYYGVCHPSVANYLSMTSGATWQCGTDNLNTYSTANIGSIAQSAGLSWKSYEESMPSTCDSGMATEYTSHHNPFVYYSNIVNNATLCNAHDVSFNTFYGDVNNSTLPAYGFFAPNRADDAHDTNVTYADTWLKGWLSPYLNATWFNSTVWFVVYDEGGTNNGYGSLAGGHVYLSAVSPYAKMNYTYTNDSTHFDLLSTTEWLLGLNGTGHNDSSSSYPPMKAMFNFTQSPPPPSYTVSGRVTASPANTPISGALVSLAGGTFTTTNGTGSYSFSLQNGSYAATAAASGYVSQTANFTIAGGPVVQNFSLAILTGQNRTYSLTGTVSASGTGAPLSGASLSIAGGSSTLTNPQGQYAFLLKNGSYTLTAIAAGYRAVSAPVTIAGSATTQNFSLAIFTYSVSGTVQDRITSAPLSGATLRQGGTLLATTPSNGAFGFPLANGSYSLAVAAPSYTTATWNFQIAGQSISSHVVQLDPIGSGWSFSVSILFSPSGTPQVNQTVIFSTVVSGTSSTLSYNWTFGDGGTSTQAAPSHAFSSVGKYTVGVRTHTPNGSKAVANLSVTVTALPSGPGSGGSTSFLDFWNGAFPWNFLVVGFVGLIALEAVYLHHLRRVSWESGKPKRAESNPSPAEQEPR